MEEILGTIGDATRCPVALIIKDQKILLGYRHYKTDKWKDISVWTCPGGRCDEGETIEKTLRRETAEETGIDDLQIEKYLGEVTGAKEGDFVPVFLCTTLQEAMLIEPEKFSEWKWFSKENFPDTFINKDVERLVNTIL